MQIAPQDPRALFNLGWHWMKRGDLQRGMALLENGRELNVYGNQPLPTSRPLWMPDTGYNQTVILGLEGGFGDEMIHFRFGQDLVEKYNCRVHIVCQEPLAPLFSRLPWVAGVFAKDAAPLVYHNSWLPGMSAALALGYQTENIQGRPYLQASPPLTQQWKGLVDKFGAGKKIKVGLRWAGSELFAHQMFRTFPPETLLSLVGASEFKDRVQFFSFQKDSTVPTLPEGIIDLEPWLKNWDETAAAMKNMDLVISSCTSCAHLGGALGVPTWVVVPSLPYFLWAPPGETTRWYDSVRLIRQKTFGNWSDVQDEIKNKLLNSDLLKV